MPIAVCQVALAFFDSFPMAAERWIGQLDVCPTLAKFELPVQFT